MILRRRGRLGCHFVVPVPFVLELPLVLPPVLPLVPSLPGDMPVPVVD